MNDSYTSFLGQDDFDEDSALGASKSSKEESLSRLLQIKLIGRIHKNKNAFMYQEKGFIQMTNLEAHY